MIRDGLPIVHRGTTHGIGADAQAGIFNSLHIHHILKVSHVVVYVVMLDAALVQHARDRLPLHALQLGAQVLVRAVSNPIRGLRIGRAAGRRVVLKASIAGRIMGRGNHDAIGARIGQDGVGNRRGRRVAAAVINADLQTVGQQHFQGGDHGGFGQRVGIAADKNRPSNPLLCAIIHNRLGNGEDMCLIKSAIERGAAVARGTEGHLLIRVLRVRGAGVVGGNQFRDIDEVRWLCQGAGALVGHGVLLEGLGWYAIPACPLSRGCAGRIFPRLGV